MKGAKQIELHIMSWQIGWIGSNQVGLTCKARTVHKTQFELDSFLKWIKLYEPKYMMGQVGLTHCHPLLMQVKVGQTDFQKC